MTAAMLTRSETRAPTATSISDEELEAAAEESALSYTFQTDAYSVCCY